MRTLGHYRVDDVSLMAYDEIGSNSAQWVAWELQKDDYHIRSVPFDAGDVVIDVGAHVGLFSMYLAKLCPSLRVLAFEPFPTNYRNCVENMRLNAIANVELSPSAIVHIKRRLTIAAEAQNTGGASALVRAFRDGDVARDIPSTTLDEVFDMYAVDRCKLLKIDCEGMEYEVLQGTSVLDRVDYLVGEFHSSEYLTRLGRSPERLYEHCRSFFATDRLHVTFNHIPS